MSEQKEKEKKKMKRRKITLQMVINKYKKKSQPVFFGRTQIMKNMYLREG